MVGFEIHAYGSYDFTWSRGAWTEGSLWLLKKVMTADGKNPWNKGNAGTIDMIEDGFENIKDALFKQVGNMGLNALLTVTNDFSFQYQFQAMKNGQQTGYELLYLIANQKNDMGDQVMIQFCRCLIDFQMSVFTKRNNNLKITMNIDL